MRRAPCSPGYPISRSRPCTPRGTTRTPAVAPPACSARCWPSSPTRRRAGGSPSAGTAPRSESKAAAAGIAPGDILVRYNADHLDKADTLRRLAKDTPAAKPVTVEALRGAQKLTFKVHGGPLGVGIADLPPRACRPALMAASPEPVLPLNDGCGAGPSPVRLDPSPARVFPACACASPVAADHATADALDLARAAAHALELSQRGDVDLAPGASALAKIDPRLLTKSGPPPGVLMSVTRAREKWSTPAVDALLPRGDGGDGWRGGVGRAPWVDGGSRRAGGGGGATLEGCLGSGRAGCAVAGSSLIPE